MKNTITIFIVIVICVILTTGCTSNTNYQTPNIETSHISTQASTSYATVDPIIGVWTAKVTENGEVWTMTFFPDGRYNWKSTNLTNDINGNWVQKQQNEYVISFIGVNKTLDFIYKPTSDTISLKDNPTSFLGRSGNVNPTTSDVTQSTSTQSSQSNNKLTILDSHMETGEYGTIDIAGTAKNTGSSRITYGQINVKFYDSSGNLIGNGLTNINDLDPGETWSFRALYMGTDRERVASYKIGVGTTW
ncbi:MAG: FxLYD domain-containing protein [Methanoregulaceae archaeon]